MVPVTNDCESDQKCSISADLSFFGMENASIDVPRVRDDGESLRGNGFEEARVSELDSAESRGDLEDGDGYRVSGSKVAVEEGIGQLVEVTQEAGLSREETEASWMNGFKVGDMVWGKVKSHPWWPGHIFKEAFASTPVRRTKREGHVLVAFFGDSSYGWFDPAELIPFEPHFAEKSKQTTSRTFVKAVEESVDEARRRGALALACYCRNKNNFRPTAVAGYFAVDVPGFENGGIYSSRQIEKARDRFVPAEMLSFVQQLALSPQRNHSDKSVEWIQSMSLLLAYRRTVFEEFDETYAQAFGVQPVRPTKNKLGVPDRSDNTVARAAPLSGPLVIAENLGDKKGSNKSTGKASSSSSSKKSKYVLKRRDEATAPSNTSPLPDRSTSRPQPHSISSFNLGPGPEPQASLVIPLLPALREAASAPIPSINSAGDGDGDCDQYVLQKRPPAEKLQQTVKKHKESAKKEQSDAGKTATADDRKSVSEPEVAYSPLAGAEPRSVWEDFDDWILKSQQTPSATVDVSKSTAKLDSPAVVPDRQHEILKGDTLQPKLEMPSLSRDPSGVGRETVAVVVDAKSLFEKPQDSKVALDHAVKKKKEPKAHLDDGEVKKQKVRKRLHDEPEDAAKKKKRKVGTDTVDTAMVPKEDSESRKKTAERQSSLGTTAGPHDLVIFPPKDDLNSLDLQLPHLVTILRELALDPFYETEHNELDIVLKGFLRYRSVVYQKSLVVPQLADETELLAKPDSSRTLPEPLIIDGDVTSVKDVKEQREPIAAKKPSKHPLRPNDPTKAGQKRPLSDRQEEKLTKRLKKLDKLKTMSSEKKAAMIQKASEVQKKATSAAPVKLVKKEELPLPIKKKDPPRVPSPTFLVMKFPPRSTLPSIPSLKARFGRFGQLEPLSTRVHWKSYTCKVLFKYKPDAEAARNHIKNNDLFGQVKVQCYLREVEQPAEELPPTEPAGKWRPEPRPDDGPQFWPGNGNGGPTAQLRSTSYQLQQQQLSSVQPKSILKKPGDEASGVGRESSRVKFMLEADVRHEDVAVAPLLPSPEPSKSSKSVNFFTPPPPPAPLPSHPRLHPAPLSQPSHALNVNQFPAMPVTSVQMPLSPPSRAPDMHNFTTLQLPKQPPTQQLPVTLPPLPQLRPVESFQNRSLDPRSQPLHHPQISEAVGKESSKADISIQMLSLLLKCRDIVANLKSSFGYVPYHHL